MPSTQTCVVCWSLGHTHPLVCSSPSPPQVSSSDRSSMEWRRLVPTLWWQAQFDAPVGSSSGRDSPGSHDCRGCGMQCCLMEPVFWCLGAAGVQAACCTGWSPWRPAPVQIGRDVRNDALQIQVWTVHYINQLSHGFPSRTEPATDCGHRGSANGQAHLDVAVRDLCCRAVYPIWDLGMTLTVVSRDRIQASAMV